MRREIATFRVTEAFQDYLGKQRRMAPLLFPVGALFTAVKHTNTPHYGLYPPTGLDRYLYTLAAQNEDFDRGPDGQPIVVSDLNPWAMGAEPVESQAHAATESMTPV